MLIALIVFLETQRRPIFGRVHHRQGFDWFPVLIPGIGLGVIILSIAILWIRYRMSARYKAFKEAEAGNAEEGLAALQREIDERGRTADRLNSLGVLLISMERFDEALEALHEAEQLSGCTAVGLSNRGIALLRLGRFEEAEALLERACSLEPTNILFGANHCQVLAELGRIEEAGRELQRIEQIARSAHWLLRAIPAVHRSWAKTFDECRAKLANARADQATPGA